MNQFYVSIIFIGIILIVLSLVWIAFDRKRSHDHLAQMEEKKEELVGIISDAELMIEELNKFSDYIVTQMDMKNEELNVSLRAFEEKVKCLNGKYAGRNEYKAVEAEKIVNGVPVLDVSIDDHVQMFGYRSDLIIDSIKFENSSDNIYKEKSQARQKAGVIASDKVIPLNSRYKDVSQLAQRGMDVTQIARRLNMGKGEVQLILAMNK